MDKKAAKNVRSSCCRGHHIKKRYIRPELVKKEKLAQVTSSTEPSPVS